MRAVTARRSWREGLWAVPGFARFWSAFAISEVGTQMSELAWPLLAVTTLDASPRQMGLLLALMGLPHLVFTLFAGAWVDRRSRRPLLVGSDFARGALLATVPVTAWLGVLRIEQLYVLGVLVGALNVLFAVGYQSYLPMMVGRERLVEANGQMVLTSSVAKVGGPALAGPLIQTFGAPLAIAADSISYVVSGWLVRSIQEDAAPAPAGRRPLWSEIVEGLRIVWSSRRLRAVAVANCTMAICGGLVDAVFVLFATDHIGLSAGAVGAIFAAGGVGFVVGAWLSRRQRGAGSPTSAIVTSVLLMTAGQALLPLAPEGVVAATALCMISFAIVSAGAALYSINQLSLRQRLAPDHLLGRVNATMRFVSLSPAVLSALVGGFLGSTIGLRATLVLAALVLALAIPTAFALRAMDRATQDHDRPARHSPSRMA